MKLVRWGKAGAERPGIVDAQGKVRDLSGVVADIAGDALTPAGLDRIRAADLSSLPMVADGERLGPCVGSVGKLMAIGLNYSDHAKEAGMEVPKEPILFMKATSAISGPADPLIIPRGSIKTDWEAELAVVIGKPAKHVDEARALEHVAGYCVCNDVSEREWQLERGGQWTKGKSFDSFAPLGPWLVTADEVADPQALEMWLEVNGRRYQHGNTRTMVFGVAALIAYLSRLMTLHPGDVISTGTPPGVGMGQKPAVFLKPGDQVKLSVQGLGEQRYACVGEG